MSKTICVLALVLLGVQVAPAQELSATNVSTYLGNSTWRWTIFLTGPNEVLDTVNYVEYTLHPTFPNPIQRVGRGPDPRYPFGFTATGWGVFEVQIKVVFKNDQVRHMTHMLQFVPVSTQSACGAPFKIVNRHPLVLPDARFPDPVYLYVGAIHTEWLKHNPKLTVFYGYSPGWEKDAAGQYKLVSPGDIESQMKRVPNETKWVLKIQHEGDAIQFRYAATSYLLTVNKVTVNEGDFNYLDLQVCERPPYSK